MRDNRIKILMFSAGMISGAFRRMMDIIENIDRTRFKMYVAYKPDYAEWGKSEIESIINSDANILSLRGRRLFDFRGFIDLWNALQKEQINILHCWDVLGVPARVIGKLAGTKIVEELGNPPPVLISEISLKHYFINKITSGLVDGFVACSNGVMRRYAEERPVFLRNKVCSVIYNCVNIPDVKLSTEKISMVRKKYNIGDQERVLTNIGYFNEQKAQDDLLKAFNLIVKQRKDTKLFIVGWGRLESKLKNLTKELALEQHVKFTGKLTKAQVFEILSATDLFVLSSHWEGFGIVLAEAMAVGKPVVTTDTDGGREVVENGKTGVLVPINRPGILAEAVLDLLEKPDLMAKMGNWGLERAAKHFNCQQYIRGYEDFYGRVLSS